jgi:hypothetical protein
MESTIKHSDDHCLENKWIVTLFSSPWGVVQNDEQVERSAAVRFNGRNEFTLDHLKENGGRLCWSSLRMLMLKAKKENSDLFLLCSSAHCFSLNYSAGYLSECITAAKNSEADILLGAVNWFESAIQIDRNLFWLDKFQGMQFVIFFNRFYDTLLNIDEIDDSLPPDQLLSSIAVNKLLLFPFISDTSEKISNAELKFKEDSFSRNPIDQLDLLQHVKKYYSSIKINY